MSDLQVGDVLAGRYRIDARLGRGGMAEVYRAWDTRRSAFLALKLLPEDLAQDQIFLHRFQKEARVLESLQHPHIVRFYGLEQDDLSAFMLMDCIDGSTLRSEIFRRKAPFSVDDIQHYLTPICAALHFAHAQGVVHCDMKPANVLIDRAGRVFVSDFGIARLAESATVTFSTPGTPAYMSPEQCRGTEELDGRADVYALGVVLYELATGGDRPFSGDTKATTGGAGERIRWQHLNESPPPPRRAHPDVSPALEAIILRCLAKAPAERYPTAAALADALSELGGAIPAGSVYPLPETARESIPPSGPAPDSAMPGIPLPPAARVLGSSPARSLTASNGIKRTFGILGLVLLGGLIVGILVLSGESRRAAPSYFTPQAPTLAPSPAIRPTITYLLTTPVLVPTSAPLPTSPTATSTSPVTPSITAVVPTSLPEAGTTQVSPWDGMVMVYIPGDGGRLGDFWIDQTDVTNAMFAQFVAAKGYLTDAEKDGRGAAWMGGTWSRVRGADWRHPHGPSGSLNGLDHHPVVQVSGGDALAYCSWAQRRLPTEAEWQRAAQGTDGRRYPWGDSPPTGDLANFADRNLPASWADTSSDDGYEFTSPVGTYPAGASPYGVLDMAGNVWQWVDAWAEGYQVVKGGSWFSDPHSILIGVRSDLRQSQMPWGDFVGFRCAASP